jgi:hypothetical protein
MLLEAAIVTGARADHDQSKAPVPYRAALGHCARPAPRHRQQNR